MAPVWRNCHLCSPQIGRSAYEMSLGLQHLKRVFRLLHRSSLHSSFICELCPWFWELPQQHSPPQSSEWWFSNLLPVIAHGPVSTSHRSLTISCRSGESQPSTRCYTHTLTTAAGLMVQWCRNGSWVSLKGHFRSLLASVCFCTCKLAVSGKLHNEGVDDACPLPAWRCRAVTGWHKCLHCCQTVNQSANCLQA